MADTSSKLKINVEVIDNLVSAQKKADQYRETMERLKGDLKNLKDQQKKAASDSRASEIKMVEQVLAQITADMNAAEAEVKAYEASLANASLAQSILRDSTDDAAKSVAQLKSELKTLTSLSYEGLAAEEIKEIETAILTLNMTIEDAEDKLKTFGSVNALKDLKSNLDVASAAANLLAGAFEAYGGSAEVFKQIQSTISGLASTVQSLIVVTEFLEKSQLKAAASTGKMTIAQRGLNLAMKAMPIFAIISALSILAEGLKNLFSLFKRKSEATREAEAALKAYEATAKETSGKIKDINDEEKAKIEEVKLAHREKILQMKRDGASAAEIAAEEMKQQEKLADTSIEASEDRTKASQEELKALEDAIGKQIALKEEELAKDKKRHELLIAFGEEEERWYESKAGYEERVQELREETYKKSTEAQAQLDQLINRQKELNKTLGEESRLREGIALQTAELAQEQEAQAKAERDAASKRYMELAVKEIEEQRKLNQALLKAEEDYQSDNFDKRQEYAKRQFDLDQQAAQDALDLRRKFGDISVKEYKRQCDILIAQQQAFANEQKKQLDNQEKELAALKKANDAEEEKQELEKSQKEQETQARLQKEVLKMLKQEAELQKQQTKESYRELIAELEDEMSRLPNGSKEYTKMAETIKSLKLQLVADLAEIDKIASKQKLEDFVSEVDKQKQRELAADNLSARKRYEIERNALAEKMNLYKEDVVMYAALKQEMADLDQQFHDGQMERIMEYAEMTKETMSSIFEFANMQDEAKLQQATEQNEQEKQQLQAQLDANLISKDEFNKKVKQSDENLAKEQAKIARKKAIQDKAMAVFDIGMKTATAIMNALNVTPFPLGVAMAAIAGALGAAQLVAALSAPLPKAARGMYIKGKSHAGGGVPVEAEGGEMIINKRSSSMFAPLLSAINEAGGGVPFVSTSSDGGFAMRDYRRNETQSLTSEAIANAVKDAVQEVKIYTAIEDFNEGTKRYAAITDSSKF